MKILLVFTLSFISGPAGCVLTGYLGGSVIIRSNIQWDSGLSGYICKSQTKYCTLLIYSNTTMEVERFRLFKSPEGFLSVLIRRLKPQDAGQYVMGIAHGKSTDVILILTVLNDSCCAEPKSLSASPGQNINIIFNYPVEYERHYKYIVKLDNYSVFKPVLDIFTQSRESRFSVTEEERSGVLIMNISNVRETDDGVYLCGVYNKLNSVPYVPLFSEIQLLVKAKAPEEILSDTTQSSGSSDIIIIIIIIISVCVCATLLLIGGFALLTYKLKHRRTQGLRPSSRGTEQASTVYENELSNLPPYENVNAKMTSNRQDSSTSQSDSTYQTLDPLTNQADSGYTSLTTTTGQSCSQYQSLDPRTRDNSVYHTLQS